MKTVIATILIIGGMFLLMPLIVTWNALQIQMGLGHYETFSRFGVFAFFGLIALFFGWQALKSASRDDR